MHTKPKTNTLAIMAPSYRSAMLVLLGLCWSCVMTASAAATHIDVRCSDKGLVAAETDDKALHHSRKPQPPFTSTLTHSAVQWQSSRSLSRLKVAMLHVYRVVPNPVLQFPLTPNPTLYVVAPLRRLGACEWSLVLV